MRFVPNNGELASDLKGVVYVRQSWLNDLIICPERARFKLVKPEMSGPTDATIMGTAVHHGIESYLGGACDTASMGDVAYAKFQELQQEPYKETNLNPEKYEVHIRTMVDSWVDGILPVVQLGGEAEFRFKTPLGVSASGWSVWLEGTMDYVQPDGTVWDWKTASRTYYAREKQSTSLQASVYAEALRHLGKADYPVTFKFGVMVRGEKPKSQIVEVHRNLSHRNWLSNIVGSAVNMAVLMGTDTHWTTNDTSALCSEKWCSYWSICKGAYLSPADLEVPVAISSTNADRVPDNEAHQGGMHNGQ